MGVNEMLGFVSMKDSACFFLRRGRVGKNEILGIFVLV